MWNILRSFYIWSFYQANALNCVRLRIVGQVEKENRESLFNNFDIGDILLIKYILAWFTFFKN